MVGRWVGAGGRAHHWASCATLGREPITTWVCSATAHPETCPSLSCIPMTGSAEAMSRNGPGRLVRRHPQQGEATDVPSAAPTPQLFAHHL